MVQPHTAAAAAVTAREVGVTIGEVGEVERAEVQRTGPGAAAGGGSAGEGGEGEVGGCAGGAVVHLCVRACRSIL